MKLNAKDVLRTALPLILICVIVAAALGMTNELTKGPIAALTEKTELAARREVFPEAENFEEMVDTGAEFSPYIAKDAAGETVGYVFTTTGSGYGGKIKVMTGIDMDGNVTGISILSQSETVGLGANCEKESFREQFEQKIPAEGFSVYKKGTAAPEGGIEALTSATISSQAVVTAVNHAVELYQTIAEGGI